MKSVHWRVLCLLITQIFLLAFLTTLPKGVWADEVLQFAPAAISSPALAAQTIFASTSSLNHGQTGFHMLLNYALLKTFGASYWALRLPSYTAYFLGITAGFFFLSELGVSLLVSLLFAFLFGLSQQSLEHGWEARPYILLQGTVMCFLWAWQRYMNRRACGLGGVFLSALAGILFHPFFVAYAGLLVVGSFLVSLSWRASLIGRLQDRRELIRALLAALFLVVLFLFVGMLSWFHTQGVRFGFDPYEYIGRGKSLPRFMLGTFFFPVSLIAVPLLALLAGGLLWWRRERAIAPLVAPFLLLLSVLVITQTVITISVLRSQYWILQRQWVAGNALAFVIAALLVEFLVRKLKFGDKLQRVLVVAVLSVGLLLVGRGIRGNWNTPFAPSVPFEETGNYLAKVAAKKDISMSEFQALAHQNMLVGGPVWLVFQRLYGL